MSPSTLTAYYGGSGMWNIRNADGSRSYSAVVGKRGRLTKLTNRRGDSLRLDGPTADEVYRAMRRHNVEQQRAVRAQVDAYVGKGL
ncbi:MAG: hypothetical protein E6R04_03325 [Spirochaetes bacterium]|nr:MAG: hypothetical protein E6R04_03325 [Spirochaetota bacterium]